MMPAVLQLAAKSMNMSTKELLSAMEAGDLDAASFLPNFTAALREMAEPGLEKSFKSMNMSWKRMMANLALLVDTILRSGVGELFTQIFNSLSDIFTAVAPLLSFLGAFASTIIKVLIFPIRLALAAIRDIFVLIDMKLKEITGSGLNDMMAKLGEIVGYIFSLFAGVGRALEIILNPFVKLFKFIFGNSVTSRIGRSAYNAAPERAQKFIRDYSKPIIAAGSTAGKIAGSVVRSKYTTGSAMGAGAVDAYNMYNRNTVEIELKEEAGDVFRKAAYGTTGINSRG